MKKQKGITLVALVVTIVVLLILAAVSINIAFGNNGIFTQAQKAAGDTAAAVDYEANELGKLMENFVKNSIRDTQTPTEEYYLVDQVEVGDYVAYDAGTWSETKEYPTVHGKFGGYTAGTNKGISVNSHNHDYKAPTDGWRVLSKSGSGATGTVTLISAGTPAVKYLDAVTYAGGVDVELTFLNGYAGFFKNDFASYGRNATREDILQLDYFDDLRKINSYYWLASEGGSNGGYYFFTFVEGSTNGMIYTGGQLEAGIRPIIVLKSGVKTNETADTEFLGQTCWALK